MQQVKATSYENIPYNAYRVSKDERREKFYKHESHIHKQGPLAGLKAGAHKLTNDIFTYFPKGFQGSKNSDFYEFLSLGMVPNIIGSVGLVALYGLCNGKYNAQHGLSASKAAKSMGAGVLMYAVGKWASQKLARTLIHASTGVNLDMYYLNKVNELPELGRDKGIVRTQYPKVFDSVDFYRKDLLAKDSELNHENIYWYDDKIAKRAGFKKKLNAPNQTMGPKIRELKARTTALENISKYIVAATGVALGSQSAFKEISFKNGKEFLQTTKTALKDGFKSLWNGTNRNFFTKHSGKALLIGSAVGTLLTWLIPTIGFKTNPDTMKSKVDTSKEFEVS